MQTVQISHPLKKQFFLLVAALVFSVIGATAIAAPPPLQTTLTANKVERDAKGVEKFKAADKVAPGEIIQYRIDQKNVGNKALAGITAMGPIPAGTQYVAGSARTDVAGEFMVSIDGGKTWSKEPVKAMVKGADGSMVEQVVSPASYTQVKWVASKPMKSAERWSYTYRVQVPKL